MGEFISLLVVAQLSLWRTTSTLWNSPDQLPTPYPWSTCFAESSKNRRCGRIDDKFEGIELSKGDEVSYIQRVVRANA